jgi:hypothetical protein
MKILDVVSHNRNIYPGDVVTVSARYLGGDIVSRDFPVTEACHLVNAYVFEEEVDGLPSIGCGVTFDKKFW